MRISDWSSDVCSSDLVGLHPVGDFPAQVEGSSLGGDADGVAEGSVARAAQGVLGGLAGARGVAGPGSAGELLADLREHGCGAFGDLPVGGRSEEHTSELQSLMRISYAVFCLKKKKNYLFIYHLQLKSE